MNGISFMVIVLFYVVGVIFVCVRSCVINLFVVIYSIFGFVWVLGDLLKSILVKIKLVIDIKVKNFFMLIIIILVLLFFCFYILGYSYF